VGVFFDAIEEIDGYIVAGMGCEAVECFCKHVVEDDYFRERSIVDTAEHGKRGIVRSIPSVCGGKEDCRIDECRRRCHQNAFDSDWQTRIFDSRGGWMTPAST